MKDKIIGNKITMDLIFTKKSQFLDFVKYCQDRNITFGNMNHKYLYAEVKQ